MSIFDVMESSVQTYARSFPVVFNQARGVWLHDTKGKRYLDFLAGAGTLNYGHNHPVLKEALIEYIQADGIAHGLDMHTSAKAAFLTALQDIVLKPRGLDHVAQFTGPTGTNAVEAAMKLARKVTGRENIVAFTNGFHGVSLGALAATGNQHHRGGAGTVLANITRLPYDGYPGAGDDSLLLFETMLNDNSSGLDKPAAVLFEVVQGEGGLNAASVTWLKRLEAICRRHEILLIADDIQAGCGRTGTFFSFEPAGIKPDIITLSKSLSGMGLPFALVLMRPDLDQWEPGEHNGTFRGNNHAFITACKALETFWRDDQFAAGVRAKGELLSRRLQAMVDKHPQLFDKVKGRGMMQGIACVSGDIADVITSKAFERGLIIETAGPDDEVVKCLCPLVISEAELNQGLDWLEAAVDETAGERLSKAS
ncbi:diaminobutyrate--2-oxoglutarate transaminase [Zobellella denitrificans]|uniref:Diaminobutyrate--2-oxoglutarate transaminase n=1 Tax=Zobellella denitrificans TaxID=347534 RepID=A0A291HP45_9GAMM|nr:diaminobutyrate--2-oxoglutarate transaminase [Zobellella denitrificans]ATG73841.1 diaminobutyrate--2-oxoglutarate aminotransferase [Zobellella denitrificans]